MINENNLVINAVIKHRDIPFVEFQIVSKNDTLIQIQNIYSGIVTEIDIKRLQEYYYIYTAKCVIYQK